MTIDLDVAPTEPGDRPPRRRRPRRVWTVVGLAMAIVAAALVALRLGAPPAPPSRIVMQFDGPLAWVEKLVDGPPRGSLAGEHAFTSELTDLVTELVRAGTYHRHLLSMNDQVDREQEVKLLYADDIDDRRVVLLALRLPFPYTEPTGPNPFRELPGRTKVLWLAGPRGTPPSSLATVFTDRPLPGLLVGSWIASPLLVATAGDSSAGGLALGCATETPCTMVALTPPGCTVATAPITDPSNYQPEPTGSYLVRTEQTYRVENWRVTCDGVVREERLAPSMWEARMPSHDEITELLADLPPELQQSSDVHEQAGVSVFNLQVMGAPVTGPVRVLWAGPPPSEPGAAPPTATEALSMVAVAPSGDAWVASYSRFERTDSGSYSTIEVFELDTDPTAPDGMLALSLDGHRWILAIGPPSATTMRYLDPDTGAFTEAPVVDRAAHLGPLPPIGARSLPFAQLVAVDATGAVVATTRPARTYNANHRIEWY